MHQPLPPQAATPKYQRILEQLQRELRVGDHPPGARLPSEAALVRRFGVSRITVGRVMRELTRRGLVERRAGSGTFVAPPPGGAASSPAPALAIAATPRAAALPKGAAPFGLLIPDLGETEIFEPICQGMASAPEANVHPLLWGHAGGADPSAREADAWRLCEQFIAQGVAGVFFAPLEHSPGRTGVNQRIVNALGKAGVPVVLLDRDPLPYPRRSPLDLVGIDNRRAGFLACAHLLGRGCRRVGFLAYPDSAATVDARISGYREALHAAGVMPENALVQRLDPSDPAAVGAFLDTVHPAGVVCANDRLAGNLMHTALGLGRRLPHDLALVGIDDVGYAALLPVPLTSVRQPCRELGVVAMSLMAERIARPEAPAREVLLDCQLTVRASCRAAAAGKR